MKPVRIGHIGSGWWLTYPSEKYEFVNGKDDIPYMKWKIKNVPNHQSGIEINSTIEL